MNKCQGCGINIQNADPEKAGYSPKENSKYCMRCFKLRNYHEKKILPLLYDDEMLLTKINAKKVFTFFLVDLLNLNTKTISLFNKITNNKILVITKVDTLDRNFEPDILAQRIKNIYHLKDVIFFSKETGFGQREILDICMAKKKVIFTGPTSSGKSSLINYLFDKELTVSEYQNTTQDFISFKTSDYEVIDAPGFNQMYQISEKVLKRRINPRTIYLKKDYELYIGPYVLSFLDDVPLTLYFSEEIFIKTKKRTHHLSQSIKAPSHADLVFYSLGFIYIKNEATILISTLENVEMRKSVVITNE